MRLTNDIVDAVQGADMAAANTSLEARSAIVRKLEEIQEELRTLGRVEPSLTRETKRALQEKADQISRQLQQVTMLDRQCRSDLEQAKKTVLDELQHLQVGKTLEDEYTRAEQGGGSFVDIVE